MPRRTLSDARQALEQDVLPMVSDHKAREFQAALAEAEKQATSFAEGYIGDQEQEVRTARDEALRELTAVRDAFDDLLGQGSSGRVPASEYTDQLQELRGRQTQAEAQLAWAEERVTLIEQIEADPIAWFDELASRFPQMKAEVPW